MLVLRSLVFSKGLFQAGTWPLLSAGEFSRLHSQVMSVYSSIVDAGITVSSRRSHASLLQVENIIAPFVFLVVLRVKVFVRIVLQAPDPVLVVLFGAHGGRRAWIDAVEHDLRYLACNSEAFSNMAGASLHGWIERVRSDAKAVIRCLDASMKESRLNAPSAWARSKRLRD